MTACSYLHFCSDAQKAKPVASDADVMNGSCAAGEAAGVWESASSPSCACGNREQPASTGCRMLNGSGDGAKTPAARCKPDVEDNMPHKNAAWIGAVHRHHAMLLGALTPPLACSPSLPATAPSSWLRCKCNCSMLGSMPATAPATCATAFGHACTSDDACCHDIRPLHLQGMTEGVVGSYPHQQAANFQRMSSYLQPAGERLMPAGWAPPPTAPPRRVASARAGLVRRHT
jgi:hypothetical protein